MSVSSQQSAPGNSIVNKQQSAIGGLTNTTERSAGARLIIEEKAIGKKTPELAEEIAGATTKIHTGKISPLDKIRKIYTGNGQNENGNSNHDLEIDILKKAWAEYVQLLREGRNPAAQPFDLAVLRVKDANSFEAVTANTIEKQFIEQERNKLFAFLKDKLHNRLLQFNVIVEEKADDRPAIELTLTSKEQYLKMIDQYPMVKELKERLRLELDY